MRCPVVLADGILTCRSCRSVVCRVPCRGCTYAIYKSFQSILNISFFLSIRTHDYIRKISHD